MGINVTVFLLDFGESDYIGPLPNNQAVYAGGPNGAARWAAGYIYSKFESKITLTPIMQLSPRRMETCRYCFHQGI